MHERASLNPLLLRAGDVTVRRRGRVILEDISLEIRERDFITIIGPNGAGKSMLLKCLMGFYKPDEGEVVRDKDLTFGYMPQRLSPDYTIPVTVRRFLTLRRKTAMDDLLSLSAETGIVRFMDTPLYVLSGGELQRVLLTRALLDNPKLLVLDEPTQNLDVPGQLAFYKLLERLYRERPLSIIMVSHDLHMVMSHTRQVVCLFHHICCSGAPQVVAKDPEFISLFGEDMAHMMAVYPHTHDHDHSHDHSHDGGHPLEGHPHGGHPLEGHPHGGQRHA